QEADNFTDEPPERWRSPGDLPHQRSNRTATREKGTTLTTTDASSSILMIRYRVGRRDELRRGCRKIAPPPTENTKLEGDLFWV
ncbi:unnamed protein product, partial [Brassica napus]